MYDWMSRVSARGGSVSGWVFQVFFNTAHLQAELCCSHYPVDTQLKELHSEVDVIFETPIFETTQLAIRHH